jgi:D-ribose pyranase
MVVDAGFAIPSGIEVIDISLGENKPLVTEVLTELGKFFSVEKIIIVQQTKDVSPGLFSKISEAFGKNIGIEIIDHTEFKKPSREVKSVIRTGDFTAYGNVVLVSGAGNRWKVEKPG